MNVTLSIDAGIARLTLNRPERLNALHGPLVSELKDAALSLARETGVKVVVLTGAGTAFSVGGDLAEMLAHREHIQAQVLSLAAELHQAILALHALRAPLLVGVNGVAAGAGFSLVCGADLALAARSATLVSAYTRSGLTPDGGGTWFLPRVVGRQRAFQLLATNPTLSAEEALGLGLVSRVVDDALFEAALQSQARELARLPADAGLGLKRLLHREERASLEAHLAQEARSIAEAAAHPQTLARLEAFLKKR